MGELVGTGRPPSFSKTERRQVVAIAVVTGLVVDDSDQLVGLELWNNQERSTVSLVEAEIDDADGRRQYVVEVEGEAERIEVSRIASLLDGSRPSTRPDHMLLVLPRSRQSVGEQIDEIVPFRPRPLDVLIWPSAQHRLLCIVLRVIVVVCLFLIRSVSWSALGGEQYFRGTTRS
jgi:hypothetical protein